MLRRSTTAPAKSSLRWAASPRRPVQAAQRPPWAWALLGGAGGALLAGVLFAPAHWLGWALAQASGERVQLLAARGTVWSGSAQWVLSGGAASQDRSALPGRVHWRVRPQWRGLAVQLHIDGVTTQPLQIAVQGHWAGASIRVADSHSQWPASVLVGLGTPWNTLQPQGQLDVSTHGLHMELAAQRWTLAGQAQLDALAMSSRLSTLRPMGSYRFQLEGGATPRLTLSTLQGDLQLSGQGQWIGGRLRFQGEAAASPEREAALSNLLNIIGRRSGSRSVITLG